MTASLAPVGLLSFRIRGKTESSSAEKVPPWFNTVVRRCASLIELERNWDSYGGRPVHESIVQAAANLLPRLVRPSVPEPTVVPTSGGGIQIEWHTANVDLEIELASAGRISAVFENRVTGKEWERQFGSDLSALVEAAGELPDSR